MRLSDIKGERTLEVIAEIIDPIANIAEDEAAQGLFQKEKLPDGMTERSFVLNRVKKYLPVLLKKHKEDIFSILSIIDGVSQEEYVKSLNLAKLTKDCIDLLADESFMELFISAQSETSSGSARENTEGQKQ